MKFIRNILIFDGVPIAVYVILSSKIESLPKAFYLFALMTPGVAVNIEKIAIVILKRWISCY
jgi:hypothetical protein